MHVNGGNVAFGKEILRVGMAWLVDMDSGGGSPDLAELLLLVHGWFQLCVGSPGQGQLRVVFKNLISSK